MTLNSNNESLENTTTGKMRQHTSPLAHTKFSSNNLRPKTTKGPATTVNQSRRVRPINLG